MSEKAPCTCGPHGLCGADCPRRAADLAEPAMAWGIVRNGRLLHLAFPGRTDHVALLPNERAARVRIVEVREDA